jgi:hypothetical protein
MATQAKIAMRAARTIFGTPVPRLSWPEKASSTFKKGAVVFANAGFLDEAGANPALILGLACQDAQNGASDGAKSQLVELATPSTIFRGYLDTSAGEGTGTGAATDLQKGYGTTKSATGGVWYVDKNKTGANVRTVIWELWASVENGVQVVIGDIRPPILFTFTWANFQGNIGS